MSAGGRLARWLPTGAFALCALIWSSTFLFIRIGNDTLPPVWAAALRLALAAALLAVLTRVFRQPWPRGAALRAAIAFGIVDFGISLPLLYWGEKDVPSAIAAIFYAMLPLLTVAFAHVAGLERMSGAKVIAGLVGVGGVTLLGVEEIHGHTPVVPLVAVMLAAATAALAGVLLKRAPGTSAIATNAVAHAVGMPFCLAGSFLIGEPHPLPSGAGWLPVLYLTIVGSVVAFVAFAWLVQRWSVVRLGFIAVITPVLAAALGATVRHEHLGPLAIAGAAVVVIAVVLAIAADARGRGALPSR